MKSIKIFFIAAALLTADAASAQSGMQNGSGTSVPVQGTPSNAGSNRHNRSAGGGTNTSATIADDNSTGKAPLISDEPVKKTPPPPRDTVTAVKPK